MTALTQDKLVVQLGAGAFPGRFSWPVYTATTLYAGALVCVDTAHGYAVPGATSTTLIPLGCAPKQVANSGASGAKESAVVPGVFKFKNSAAGDAIAQAQCGQKCYIVDDQTVAKTDGTGTRSQAGTVIGVEADGVFVCVGPYPIPDSATYVTLTGTQTLTNKTLTTPTISSTGFTNAQHDHSGATSGGLVSLLLKTGATGSFTDGDWAPTSITAGAVYAVPATAAASTITLPAAATSGTWAMFVADGTANDETVQYRDATGPTNLTSALSASKRHCCVVVKLGTTWVANAMVSP